jgi:hypothetical protein
MRAISVRPVPPSPQARPPPVQHPGEPAAKPRPACPLRGAWPLLPVLAVQAALSLRLIWSTTAFQDEALYLRAGHLIWAHWLHGARIPGFASYFSGAPVLYPPIAAVADSVGGLQAARLLSLGLMLAVTTLLWGTTARLYGRRAALLATALFATLAGTQFLGALATYDALALSLLALAAWLTVRSADCGLRARLALLASAGAVLALADAVTYATVLFTPVVIAMAGLTACRRLGGRGALGSALAVTASWLVTAAAAAGLAGRQYWMGFTATTLDRPVSTTAITTVAQRAYAWTGLIALLAVLGALLAARSGDRPRYLPAVLAAAAVLAPAEQARLHTVVSLQKHVVLGAWFAAIAAGYALARLSRVAPGRGWAPIMAIPIAASTLFGSIGQASALVRAWPDSAQLISVLRPALRAYPGHYLAEDYDVEAYYLRAEAGWRRWSSTYYFSYPGTPPGAAAYRAAIARHYFSLVILDFRDTAATDHEITADMALAGGYYVLTRAGAFTIWASDGR